MTAPDYSAAPDARKLSPTQRAKLADIAPSQPREYPLGQTGHALIRIGLVFVNELGARHLTDAGHAVLRGGE